MTLSEFREFYASSAEVKELIQHLHKAGQKVQLRGLVGSVKSIIAAATTEVLGNTQLFILDDKEEAAYFMNDLQEIFKSEKNILFFPRSAKVPYDTERVDNANVAMRAEVLNEINTSKSSKLIVTYPEALSEKVVTKQELSEHTFTVKKDAKLDIEFIDEMLIEYEFEKVDYVFEPGQFSVRGGIVDVFSFSFDQPYRIEFFDDEVESIRKFDPVSQLSSGMMEFATIIPNVGDKTIMETRESLLKFIPEDACVWMTDFKLAAARLDKYLDKAKDVFNTLDGPIKHSAPEEIYMQAIDLKSQLEKFKVIEFGNKFHLANGENIVFKTEPQPSFNKNFELLAKNLNANKKRGLKNYILSDNPQQIERIYSIFEDTERVVAFTPMTFKLHEGFIDNNLNLACYTDHQIFDRYHRFKLKEGFKKNKQALTLKELSSLHPGDFVVHIDHGVGKFSGLEKIDVNGKKQEAIRLIYKDSDILYVSIHSLHRISKYTGKEGTQPTVHKLGGQAWEKVKSKTKSRVKELAFNLISLYAKRKASKGFAFAPDNYLMHELEASFMFEDTPDQILANEAVKKDMEAEAPMDRLICGDVGFGKTEIAIRAAFKAVCDNKQVAILVPTTVLSIQHYKNLKERLKEFPVTVDYVNRFKSGKKMSETLQRLEEGKIDIIVGTHALVGKRIKFMDLGLLIIDEEQKFGVGIKDKLKTMKANLDTLTMTATPIPRTLQFSLMGARDLSLINTPPPNRQSVETEVTGLNEELIRDAISYELARNGQVFFVHNRVQNIKEVQGMIQRVVPDAKVVVGHGQMEGDKLEQVMEDFVDHKYDVLLATTIIESGIDISNANTMIINNAQNFGLSDLHQLRGRVGRSNKKAFCYLLAPPTSVLPGDAKRRLQAIEQFSELGSGMNISMRDLDIRGAGNIFGGEQSGFMADVGFEMYNKILNEAIEELKETEFKHLVEEEEKQKQTWVKETALETDLELLIPDAYVQSITERLALYKQLEDATEEKDLQFFEKSLIDRFGELPQQVDNLIETLRLKWIAQEIGFEKLVLKSSKMICYFVANQESGYYQSPAFTRVLQFVQANPRSGKMYEKNDGLRFSFVEVQNVTQAKELLAPIIANPKETVA